MPVFSSGEWHARGTDEPDVRDAAAVSPAGLVPPPPAAPGRPAAPAEPSWVDPPFAIWQPTIDGNLTVFDDGTGQWGVITCRVLNAQTVNGIVNGIVSVPASAGNGVTDATSIIQAAITAAGSGTVFVPAGSYVVSSTITVPEAVSLEMDPQAVILYHGSGACISHHGSNDSFTPTFARPGRIRGGIIDGTSAAAGAIGLDVGDGRYHDVKGVLIRHFNGAGSVGAYLVNRNTFTEMSDFQIHIADCTAHVVMDVAGGLTSHMYSNYDFAIFANASQDGLVIAGGSQPSRCNFRIRGNFQSGAVNTGAVIRITGAGSSVAQSFWDLGVEADGALAASHQTFVTAAAGNIFTNETGILAYLNPGGATPFSPASLADNWNFTGPIFGDSTLSNPATPAVPASGTTLTNHANGATVYITGGTVTGISVDGVATGLTSGTFHLGANSGTIKLTYSVAPTWVWVWDTQ